MNRLNFPPGEAVVRLAETTGRRFATRTIENWLAAHPALRAKIGGYVNLRGEALAMIEAGVPVAEAARRLAERDATAKQSGIAA